MHSCYTRRQHKLFFCWSFTLFLFTVPNQKSSCFIVVSSMMAAMVRSADQDPSIPMLYDKQKQEQQSKAIDWSNRQLSMIFDGSPKNGFDAVKIKDNSQIESIKIFGNVLDGADGDNEKELPLKTRLSASKNNDRSQAEMEHDRFKIISSPLPPLYDKIDHEGSPNKLASGNDAGKVAPSPNTIRQHRPNNKVRKKQHFSTLVLLRTTSFSGPAVATLDWFRSASIAFVFTAFLLLFLSCCLLIVHRNDTSRSGSFRKKDINDITKISRRKTTRFILTSISVDKRKSSKNKPLKSTNSSRVDKSLFTTYTLTPKRRDSEIDASDDQKLGSSGSWSGKLSVGTVTSLDYHDSLNIT